MDDPKRYADTIGGLIEHEDGGLFRADDPAIVQALAVRKACHEAGLLDEHGNLRRIIGTLPVTADGCVVGNQWSPIYYVDAVGKARESCLYHRGVKKADVCYSTRSAAERAAGGSREASDGR